MDALRNPEGKVKLAEKVTEPLVQYFPALPTDTTTLVRMNGGIQVGAAVLLSLGRFRRTSALILMASLVPTTLAGHRFWEELDEEKRAQQLTHLLKNIGIMGGLVLAASDNEGAPSLSWRVRRQMRSVRKASPVQRGGSALKRMSDVSSRTLNTIEDVASREAAKGANLAGRYIPAGAEFAGGVLSQAMDRVATVTDR
jgi:putative oxidoreductase